MSDIPLRTRDWTPEEREQALEDLDAPDTFIPPKDRIKTLQSIVADKALPYSLRSDSRRLIDISEIFPREFAERFAELMETLKENDGNQS
jgi:hypothetical protein